MSKMKGSKINFWFRLVTLLMVVVVVLGLIFQITQILDFKLTLFAFIPLLILYQVLYMVKNRGKLTKVTKVILLLCIIVLSIILVDNVFHLIK